MAVRTVVVVSLLLALAGCVTAPNAADLDAAGTEAAAFGAVVPPVPDFDWTTVVDADHANHQLPALHMGGHGLALVGHAAVGDILGPTTRGSITQVDVWQNYAVVSGMEGGLAFAIVDITDPSAPKAISWWPSAADGWTARFSDDGNYVFYGCQMFGVGPSPGIAYNPTSHVIGTCADPEAPHLPTEKDAGIIAIDVSDKANPKFVHFLAAAGSHNIFSTSINGTDYIVTASTAIIKFDRETMELVQISDVPGVHDASIAKHPITGDWLLFTGTGELSIYNLNDPAQPEIVYEGTGEEGWVGWHEQTMVPGIVDGRVILVLAGEHGTSTGPVMDSVYFVDITDPAMPTLLSQWDTPFQSTIPWASYTYSVHEIAATPTGQVAIAWYHAGMWVLDVSTKERQAAPVTLAAYLPHELPNVTPSTFAQTPVPLVPFVWGAGWDARGYLIVPDMHTGLYVMEPEWGLHKAIDGGQ